MKNFLLLFIAMCLSVLFANAVSRVTPPKHLTAAVLNSTTVKLSWDGDLKDFSYRLCLRPQGVVTWTCYTVEAPTCSRRITDLKPGVTYQWKVQTLRSEARRDTSVFATGKEFTPWMPCDAPQNPLTYMTDNKTAVLTWFSTDSNAVYTVSLHEKNDSTFVNYITRNTSLRIAGLQPDKDYEWIVTASCVNSGMVSVASDTERFSTNDANVYANADKANALSNDSDAEARVVMFATTSTENEKISEAQLTNPMGQKIGTLPLYYTASDGTVAFDVKNDVPPGLYNVTYRCNDGMHTRAVVIY